MVSTRRRTRSLSNSSARSGEAKTTTTTRRRRTRSLSNAEPSSSPKDSAPLSAGTSKPEPRQQGRTRSLSREKEGNFVKETASLKVIDEAPGPEQSADPETQPQTKSNDNTGLEETAERSKGKGGDGKDIREDTDEDSESENDHDGNDGKLEIQPIQAAKQSMTGSRQPKAKNALTHLIPGYTAPMKLLSSSLDKFRPAGGIRELQKRAERTDASTKDFVLEATSKHTRAMSTSEGGLLPKSYTTAYSSFKRGTKRPPDTSVGKGWFGMTPTPLTEEVKTDLAVIRNRTYLDPKRFYKSADKHHRVVQVGTVVEGASEYFSSRLTKKERRSNFTDEIMADPASSDYAKNKFKQMSREKTRQAELRKQKPKKARKFY
ncbi:Fcf2 pre-rRNA processing [Nitzschia inconspicua]|uniref:Fcf2 pre-rRNA processing n=1 Tax=Nitzschia inconspicua TaxID=303405 RepID=A0A9K3Q349_9STRA|nr:Fcf2 pre-rRNA processing [Nitzschia inconspicua]KAG7368695.1 Fcf2 pre-rRNA processing [Nitzschia inconspicua]